jgi:hypothetical protein
VGSTPTLPPNQQPPPASRDRRTRRLGLDADRDLVLDVAADRLSEEQVNEQVRAAESHAEYLHEYGELGSDRRARIEAAQREWLHHQPLEADPSTRLPEEAEPLGRRLPEPLDASREGVER